VVVGALLLALLAIHGAPAHEAEPDQPSPYDRYRESEAYLRSSPAEMAAFDAEMAPIPGADVHAVEFGADLDGDGDPDEIHIRLEVIEIQEEVYPGEFVNFWVFAPLGQGMSARARLPSPTIVVEEEDRVQITLYNTHYLPHTIHLHGTTQSSDMDGAPDMPHPAILPGQSFTYSFVAKRPGTFFYHCHVQDQAHISMGLAGMLIIEPQRPNNHFVHVITGAGHIPFMGKATAEEYQAEYSLVYMDIDDRLNRIPAAYSDPREIERRMHRDYDVTQRRANIFLLNGRSFPFTARDTPIIVRPDEVTRLRILNVGPRTVYLHTHGHHPTLTHLDGYPVPNAARITRDTFDIGPSQRVDLALRTGADGTYASGPGVWMMHDHAQPASSNKGINPGGDHTVIAYEKFMGEDGMPKGMGAHMHHLDAAYYRGERPVFPPSVFGTTQEHYDDGLAQGPQFGGSFDYPTRQSSEGSLPRLDLIESERHRVVANSCSGAPRGFRRLYVRAGHQFARPGEVFAFEPRHLHAEPCEEVEVVLENVDSVRHDLMVAGLGPMFSVGFVGPGTLLARFVTPDEDVTLPFHCHVPAHDKVGMVGELTIGKGGSPKRFAQTTTPSTPKTVRGIGTVIAILPRTNRLVVDHEEIKGFMAAMEMSYPVASPALFERLKPGDRISFEVDPAASVIKAIAVIEPAK
jgi:FtsP/CotA-like multicopper oxidase with cupredoxin domain/Cu/Ag efflux protein CusF